MNQTLQLGNLALTGNLKCGKMSGIVNPIRRLALEWSEVSRFELQLRDPQNVCHSWLFDGSVQHGVSVTLDYLPGDSADFAVCRFTFECASDWRVDEVKFTLPRFRLPGEDCLVVPQNAGMRYPNPGKALFQPLQYRNVRWNDREMCVKESGLLLPEELERNEKTETFKATMSYLDYYSPDVGGVYLGAHDPGFENTYFSFGGIRGEPGIVFSVNKVFNRPLSRWCCDFVIGLHPGDWHTGADYYRRYFDTTGLRPRRSTEVSPGLSCHYDFLWQNGDINHRFRDIPEVARIARGQGFDTVLCAAWNRGGFDTNYPDFRPDPRLGSEAELKAAVQQLQNEGSKVLFYINAYSFDRDSSGFAIDGSRSAVRQTDGSTVDVRWGSRILTAMCNGSDWWCEKVLDNIRYVTQELGADGVYIDQLNVLPPICHAVGHRHESSVICRNMWLIGEARRRFGDRILLISEWSFDAMGTVLDFQLLQTCWRNLAYAFPELFRYTFPEAGTVDMILQKPWPGVDPEVEGRYVRDVFDRMFLSGIKFWCYDHVPFTPGFEEYFKRGIALRQKFNAEFNAGLFRDDADLAEVPAGVIVKTFDLPHGRMVAAANRTGKNVSVKLRNNTVVPISSDELSITIIP